MDVEINYVAVALAAASSMVVGYIWYNPRVFGDAWVRLAKLDPKKSNMAWSTGAAIVSSLVMAYVLAHMAYLMNHFYNNGFLQDTLTTAAWVWLGFQALRIFQRDQFNQRRKIETLIHAGNDFVTIMAMALIIGIFGN